MQTSQFLTSADYFLSQKNHKPELKILQSILKETLLQPLKL